MFFRNEDSIFPVVNKRAQNALYEPENTLDDSRLYEKVSKFVLSSRLTSFAADFLAFLPSPIQFAEHLTDVAHVVAAGDVCESLGRYLFSRGRLTDLFDASTLRFADYYELQPSVVRWRSPTGWLNIMNGMIEIHQTSVDNVIIVWEGDLTPHAAPLSKGTYKNFYEVGPQLPPVEWDQGGESGKEFAVEGREGGTMAFLDRAVEEKGERSMLLIRRVLFNAFEARVNW